MIQDLTGESKAQTKNNKSYKILIVYKFRI